MTPIINARLADMPYLVRKTLTEYPPELLAARRAAFVKQIREYDAKSDGLWDSKVPSTKEQLDDAGFGSFGPM
jgi:hypothetical protein